MSTTEDTTAAHAAREGGGTGDPRYTPAHPPPPIGPRGVVIGTILLGLLLIGFAVWANEAGKRAGAEAERVPEITILEPADGAVVGGVAEVVFETAADLRRGPAGWEAGRLHIHASVDGMELMPGADDIDRLDAGRYRWRIRPLQPGTREIRLFWSDLQHRPIPAGASRTLRIDSR